MVEEKMGPYFWNSLDCTFLSCTVNWFSLVMQTGLCNLLKPWCASPNHISSTLDKHTYWILETYQMPKGVSLYIVISWEKCQCVIRLTQRYTLLWWKSWVFHLGWMAVFAFIFMHNIHMDTLFLLNTFAKMRT